MNVANTLFSTLFHFAIGLGIALGAICLRLGSAVTNLSLNASVLPFQIALLIVAGVSITPLWGLLRLHRDAGDLVAGRVKG